MRKNNEGALTRRGTSALVRHREPREEYLTPVADIFETSDAFVVRLDMPGAKKESLVVSAEPMLITVKGPVEKYHTDPARTLVSETVTKAYYRVFNLTRGLDHTRIQAEFEDGVLTMTIPKNDEMKLKEIPIQ
ncbi:MAG: Hsp20/alpha crystallin family protein [Ignavibacteriales bacterium]|nr:Hsp20/alpha crystallin family protein [Ignavibacteriales bacterium]